MKNGKKIRPDDDLDFSRFDGEIWAQVPHLPEGYLFSSQGRLVRIRSWIETKTNSQGKEYRYKYISEFFLKPTSNNKKGYFVVLDGKQTYLPMDKTARELFGTGPFSHQHVYLIRALADLSKKKLKHRKPATYWREI